MIYSSRLRKDFDFISQNLIIINYIFKTQYVDAVISRIFY